MRELEERRLVVLGKLREPAMLRLHPEPSARMDRELIARQMLRLQGDSRGQLELPVLRRLPAHTEDEIDRDGVEARGQGGFDRGRRLSAGVTPAEETQRLVRE